MRGDHVVDVPANRLVARVAEEALGGGIPRGNGSAHVEGNDRGRARIEERLVVAPLPLQLSDVGEDPVVPDLLALDEDRAANDVDVDERPVLARSPGDDVDVFSGARPAADLDGLAIEVRARRDQGIDLPAHGFVPAVTEQALCGRVPVRDDVVHVDDRDRGRARLQQRLVVPVRAMPLAHRFAPTGRVKVKVEPSPGSLTRPRCGRRAARPGSWTGRGRGRCPRGARRWCRAPAGTPRRCAPGRRAAMPGPVSRTAILHLAVLLRGGDVHPPARGGELDRVGEQVEDDLADAALVAFDQVDGGSSSSSSCDAVLRRALPDHDHPALAVPRAGRTARARAPPGRPRPWTGRGCR